jgi:parallel beta-helix repeat protein
VTANVEGIYLQDSSSNVVSGNNATENSQYGIYIVYCSDNTVSGNNITANTDYGIQLTSSNSSVIDCNNVTANGYGIFISSSSNNIFSGDNVTANSLVGFYIWQSTEDTVSLNNVTANGEGFYLGYSSNSTVSGNNVMANIDVGIDLLSSSNNVIFHNNFINNTSQALISNSTNTWDNGYPSGGNYWSNYNGTDFFSGPYQNVTGSDGIGDVPYVIDANNTDHYPLMGEFSDFTVAAGVDVQVVSNSTVSDFQFNGTAILFSVSGASGTTGFCSVRVPTSLLNGTLTVFVNGTQVQYDLLLGSNSSISYLYFTYGHSTEQVTILPEFPESLIIAMLLAMLSAVAVHNKKHSHS